MKMNESVEITCAECLQIRYAIGIVVGKVLAVTIPPCPTCLRYAEQSHDEEIYNISEYPP